MAILYITEFRRMAEDARGNVMPVGELPPVASHSVTYTSNANSVTFHKQTRLVRLLSDADAYIKIGTGTQTATKANGMKLEASVAEYFGVDCTQSMQIGVYDGTT